MHRPSTTPEHTQLPSLSIAVIPPHPCRHLLTSMLSCKVMRAVLSPSPLFISVHRRWPSLGTCFCICLCSDHRQIEEDMTNIILQLLKRAVPTRLCTAAAAERGGSDVLSVTFLKSPPRRCTELRATRRGRAAGNRRGLPPGQSFC